MPSKTFGCEVRTLFKTKEGKKEHRWTVKPVRNLPSGSHPDIRCMHCHGAVRVHKSHIADGPADHVEHLSRQDSEGCIGGVHFDGAHRLSASPVE